MPFKLGLLFGELYLKERQMTAGILDQVRLCEFIKKLELPSYHGNSNFVVDERAWRKYFMGGK